MKKEKSIKSYIPIRAKLYAHQVEAYEKAMETPKCALLMEQGTGKTMVALAAMSKRWQDSEVARVLIVAPASVLSVWEKEIQAYLDVPYVLKVFDKGTAATKEKRLTKLMERPADALKIAVINYESVWRMGGVWADYAPDLIICDESQRIKNYKARQSKYMHVLGSAAPYKMILTGTPVTQSPLDFWSQYRFLDPSIFTSSYWAFRARYAVMGGYEGKQVIGFNHLNELAKRAHGPAYRVTKAAALDLPGQVDQVRYVKLPPDAMRIYKDLMRQDYLALEAGELTVNNMLTRQLRYSQITGGHIAYDDGSVKELHKAKLNELDALLDEISGKVVLFCRFIPEITAIEGLLDRKGIGYTTLHGSVPKEKRGENIRRFQEDGKCRVIIAQLQAAGLGITLTAASTSIFYSLNYSYADYEQCRARTHRIGQTQKCTYIHLIAENTIDHHIMDILKNKGTMAKLVVDDWKKLLKGG